MTHPDKPNHLAPSFKAVLFDLDGTLVDSIGDLSCAANAARIALDLPPLPQERIAQFVGRGANNLIHRTLSNDLDGNANPQDFEKGMAVFKKTYHEINGQHTKVLPGVYQVLDRLQSQSVEMGIVTNKPSEFTLPLLSLTQLKSYFKIVVSGDTCSAVKPSPTPILYACEQLNLCPAEVLFIGDSSNDVIAAKAAGCYVCLIAGGYHEDSHIPLEQIGANKVLHDFSEINKLFPQGNIS